MLDRTDSAQVGTGLTTQNPNGPDATTTDPNAPASVAAPVVGGQPEKKATAQRTKPKK